MRARRITDRLVLALFALGIFAPALQQITGLLPEVEVVDNRELVPFPPLTPTPEAIAVLPRGLEAWYADHLGLRGAMISGYRWLTDTLLRSPDKTILGRAGWLYLRKGITEDVDAMPLMRDWCGRAGFTERQLDEWVATITANRDWLARRGIGYLFVVPPNKLTVLPGHLPARFRCRRGATRLDQLEEALRRRGGIEVVDLRPALWQSAAAGAPIWYRTDTHWNARGVAAAYAPLMSRIRALLPNARAIESFDVRAGDRRLGDLGRMVQAGGVEPDIAWAVAPRNIRSHSVATPFPAVSDRYGRRSSAREVDDPSLPTAMVLHDSFFDGAMNDFLSESFSRSVFVFQGHPAIDRDLVLREHPDIVIQEMVERNLLHPFFAR